MEFEPDSNIWVAYCPELGRGTCYSSGETQQEALSLLQEVKKDIIQYAIDEGHPIPEPKFEDEELPSGQFVVRLPKTLHKKLKDEANKENVSLNLYVTNALSEQIGRKQILNSFQQRWTNLEFYHPSQPLGNLSWTRALYSRWSIFNFETTTKKSKSSDSELINLLIGNPNAEIQERRKTKGAFFIPERLQSLTIED